MKLKPQQICTGSDGAGHTWQPLFAAPDDAGQERQYLARGHADYLECPLCGAVALRDGATNMLTLSQTMSDSKRREAAAWSRMQHAAPASSS